LRLIFVGLCLVAAATAFVVRAEHKGLKRALPATLPACSAYAAPGPHSVTKLLVRLRPGEAGCLRNGLYREDVAVRVGGTREKSVVLRAAPGARATIRGRFLVREEAHDVVISGIALDGRNPDLLPSPTVLGDRIIFLDVDVSNSHTSICFALGSVDARSLAENVVIARSRIHDCGRLPPTNHDHGIYVENAHNTWIVDNLIYDNADRGVQLYPNAQETLVEGNVIDRNGEGVMFSGDGGLASSGNRVVDNVISNSRVRHNIESWWPRGNPVGHGNVASRNCLWNGTEGNVGGEIGFTASDNAVADPRYADRTGFRLRSGSACAGKGPRNDR
jgi:parallel beta-helix repeat protein